MDNNGVPPPAGSKNLGPTISGLDWASFTTSTVFVTLRLLTRWRITRDWGWDDSTILLAQAIVAVGKSFVELEIKNGLGQHKDSLEPGTYEKYLKYDYFDWIQVS